MGLVTNCCAFTVLLIGLGVGLWLHELTTFRSASGQWVNWIGDFACGSKVVVERPTTLEELQAVVRRHKQVRAAATGRSFSYFHCPSGMEGATIDMTGFKHAEVKKLETGEYTITAEAGLEMGQLQNTLLGRGLTLRVPPGNPGYSVGGVVSCNSHNLGQAHSEDLLDITFVLHDGTVKTIHRGDPDWFAAGVSHGRLGVVYRATYLVLPYRQFQWSMESFDIPDVDGVLEGAADLARNVTSKETSAAGNDLYTGNKIVIYLTTGVMLKEYWVAQGRGEVLDEKDATPLKPYNNTLMFRLGQGIFSRIVKQIIRFPFSITPLWLLHYFQQPCEHIFRAMHTSVSLQAVRQAVGWQHSPQSRGDMSARPTGHQYTWAGWLDEAMNFAMMLEHMEVIFPLEPKEEARKCLQIVFAHKHLMWWRFNIRVMQSDNWYLSSVHMPGKKQPMVRVDFIMPAGLVEQSTGADSLSGQLHHGCKGWRNHWGKGMHKSFSDMRFGDPEAFNKVAHKWDPNGKFRPMGLPAWTE